MGSPLWFTEDYQEARYESKIDVTFWLTKMIQPLREMIVISLESEMIDDPHMAAAERWVRALEANPPVPAPTPSIDDFYAEMNRMLENSIRQMLTTNTNSDADFKGLKYYIDRSEGRETTFIAQINDEAIAERDGRIARRAAGPVFAKKTEVRLSTDVPGWNDGCAARPPIGLTGKVIAMLDATDDVEKTGMVQVRFKARDLGYLSGGSTVDYYIPNDCLEAV
jgi:hypothetical protein